MRAAVASLVRNVALVALSKLSFTVVLVTALRSVALRVKIGEERNLVKEAMSDLSCFALRSTERSDSIIAAVARSRPRDTINKKKSSTRRKEGGEAKEEIPLVMSATVAMKVSMLSTEETIGRREKTLANTHASAWLLFCFPSAFLNASIAASSAAVSFSWRL